MFYSEEEARKAGKISRHRRFEEVVALYQQT
jgi:hypothetical protein